MLFFYNTGKQPQKITKLLRLTTQRKLYLAVVSSNGLKDFKVGGEGSGVTISLCCMTNSILLCS